MSRVSEAISWLAWFMVTDDSHGYSQPNREGDGSTVTYQIPDWGPATMPGGDEDCSSMVKHILKALGIPTGGFTYTGNEKSGLLSTGLFTAYRAGSVTPQDGDILLREGHTEVVVNGGTEQAGFRRSENHSITGRKGDQDGQEATHSALRIGTWTWIIRYTGPDVGPDEVGTLTGHPSKSSRTSSNKEDIVTNQDKEDIANLVVTKIKDEKADPTGRNQNLNIFDHVKWLGAAIQEVNAKLSDVLAALKELKAEPEPDEEEA